MARPLLDEFVSVNSAAKRLTLSTLEALAWEYDGDGVERDGDRTAIEMCRQFGTGERGAYEHHNGRAGT